MDDNERGEGEKERRRGGEERGERKRKRGERGKTKHDLSEGTRFAILEDDLEMRNGGMI